MSSVDSDRPAILITGGSRGIGRATALLAAERGCSVAINYVRDSEAARRTASDIVARHGRAAVMQGDVADEGAVTRMFEAATSAFGRLDGVVLNAGIVAPPRPLAEMDVERLRRMFEVNVLGRYLCARQAACALSTARGGRGGSIVIVSSTAARLGAPSEYVDYAGAKAADTLALGLAKDLANEGVRVNAVRPGLIDTDIYASSGRPDRAQRLGASTPTGRPGRPEEVAEAIVWHLGPSSSYVTGAILDVAGGR